MKKVLIIAPYYYCNNSAGIAIREFVSALVNANNECIVVSKKNEDHVEVSAKSNINNIEVKESKCIFYAEKILRRLSFKDITLTPDIDRYSWNWSAYKVAYKLCKENEISIIHTISFPCSSHLVGLKLKRDFGIKWVAQFYDPWVGNPIRMYKYQKIKRYDNRMERLVAENSDFILHTNSGIVDDWVNRYGQIVSNKIHELPLICSWKPEPIKNRKEVFRIVHIGTLFSGRSGTPLIEAIHYIKQFRPDIISKIEIIFVGGCVSSDIRLVNKYGLNDTIKILGKKPERECDFYYGQSDLFVAIDCYYDYDFFYPSKILKYFRSQKPIIGIVSGNTVLKKEMERSGNVSFSFNSTDLIGDYLIKCVEGSVDLSSFDQSYWIKYSPESVISYYLNITK